MTATEPACVPRDLDEALDPGLPRRPFGRRGALRAGGAALMAGLVAACYGSGGSRVQNSPCCSLAKSRICDYAVSYDRWVCPGGYYRTLWSCMHNTELVWCGECSSKPQTYYVNGTPYNGCHAGPWYCSTWFYNRTGGRLYPG